MFRFATCLSAVCLVSSVFAAGTPQDPAPAMSVKPPVLTPAEADLKKVIEERLKLTVDEITPLPIAGMYEIRVGTKLIYADTKGDYVFTGNLIDLRARVNLTSQRTDMLEENALPKVKFADLPLASAIKIVKGNGKGQIAVFEDPNCAFCKRLEHSFESVNDATIYIFLFPVLGDDSIAKSKSIWCAKDPAKTWTAWMMDATPIGPVAACNTATIDQNIVLGKKLDVSGTPTLFFTDGKRVPGAISGDEINKRLAAAG